MANSKFTVKARFKDAKEFVKAGAEPKIYEEGTDVSDFDQKRLASLVERGLVEEVIPEG